MFALLTIPEFFAQTQVSDQWQIIHYSHPVLLRSLHLLHTNEIVAPSDSIQILVILSLF